MRRNSNKTKGSLTVEMMLFMIPFMLAFFTVINFARFIQAEMIIHHAITQTAKEISAYSYVLTKTGITSRMQNTHGKSDEFTTMVDDTINAVGDFATSFGTGDVSTTISSGEIIYENVGSVISDPGSVISSIFDCIQSGLEKMATTAIAGALARGSIEKQISLMNSDVDEYLEGVGIIGGLGGLDFSKTTWIGGGPGKGNIEVVVTFRMKNQLFPMFDFGKHEYVLTASTLCW